jgi:hypothetical protein
LTVILKEANMLDSRDIHSDWVHFFESVHTSEGWITPLLDAVKAVPVEAAAWKPAPGVASIWEVVVHATGWTEELLGDLAGTNGLDITDWPPVLVTDPGAWQQTIDRLESVIIGLERAVNGLSVEDIYSPAPRTRKRRSERMTNIFVHNAYHAGQVIKLRQLFAAQHPSTASSPTSVAAS